MDVKRCSKCGREKPLGDFHKDNSTKDGWANNCKICRRNYRVAHWERWRESNRERCRKWYGAHRQEQIECRRKYYQEHKEEQKASHRKYKQEHEEETKARNRAYHLAHLDERRASHRNYNHKESVAWREKVFDLLGAKCVRCGFSDKRALQIDHIHGGGSKERRMGMIAMYQRIIDCGGEGYQMLCANCNAIKKIENGEVRRR